MVEKMVARRTEVKAVMADTVARRDRVEKLRGREKEKEMTEMTSARKTLQIRCGIMVERYCAPARQWKA